MPVDIRQTLCIDLNDDDYDDSCRFSKRTVVAVEVHDMKNGAVHYWSLPKLQYRLQLMRDLYQNEPLLMTETSDHGLESITGGDPFYDRFPWFRLIGRSFVYLTNLLYPMSLVQKVAIVNEKGDVMGHLRVAIQTVIEDDNLVDGDESCGSVKQSARISFEDGYNVKGDDVECDADSGHGDSSVGSIDDVPDHLKCGKEFSFKVIVLQALDIPLEFSDVFCQFKYV